MPLTSEQKRRKKVSKELGKLPLKTLEDYDKYNDKARELGIPIKPAPAELHEHMRVKFLRRDGMVHEIPLKFRNAKIDFYKKVRHGHIYDLPKIVIREYQKKGIQKYGQKINHATGESETVETYKDPKFAFQVVLDD